jgi:hypothetical protein
MTDEDLGCQVALARIPLEGFIFLIETIETS